MEALASICPIAADLFMGLAFVMTFSSATPFDCKELDKVPLPASGRVTVVPRPTHVANPLPLKFFPGLPTA